MRLNRIIGFREDLHAWFIVVNELRHGGRNASLGPVNPQEKFQDGVFAAF